MKHEFCDKLTVGDVRVCMLKMITWSPYYKLVLICTLD